MSPKKIPKNPQKIFCETCDYVTSSKKDYNKHLTTRKHKIRTNTNNDELDILDKGFACECGKKYKHASSLWNHKQKCEICKKDGKDGKNEENVFIEKKEEDVIIENTEDVINKSKNNNESNTADLKEMFLDILNENKELRKQTTELIPKVGNNNNNNIFNLNLFLNDQCKDAMNLIDFVKSLQTELSQLEYTGSHGFVEGISNIFTNAIENMDITKRPIHCTDLKREVLYIKENEEWMKENEEKSNVKNAIKMVQQSNISKIKEWVKENPECQGMNHPKNDLFLNIVKQHTTSDDKDFDKVVKTIAKQSTIPKDIKSNFKKWIHKSAIYSKE